MSHEVCHALYLPHRLQDNGNNPAMKVLGHGNDYNSNILEYTETQRQSIVFVNNKIYQHKCLRINYTSYDCQQAQDTLNPQTHANAMVLSHKTVGDDGKTPFPYWFCRIIGIFHAMIQHIGPESKSPDPYLVEFLWV
ncbi:hypothetical protein C0991_004541 [Blastosporella zonata]|nr:hypothetical protein C0991_004541 [Blastosporella zonata]